MYLNVSLIIITIKYWYVYAEDIHFSHNFLSLITKLVFTFFKNLVAHVLYT